MPVRRRFRSVSMFLLSSVTVFPSQVCASARRFSSGIAWLVSRPAIPRAHWAATGLAGAGPRERRGTPGGHPCAATRPATQRVATRIHSRAGTRLALPLLAALFGQHVAVGARLDEPLAVEVRGQ